MTLHSVPDYPPPHILQLLGFDILTGLVNPSKSLGKSIDPAADQYFESSDSLSDPSPFPRAGEEVGEVGEGGNR